jgi:choline-glycine betaine transporter
MFDIIYDVLLILLVVLWSVRFPVKLLHYAKRDKDYILVTVLSVLLLFAGSFVGLMGWEVISRIRLV